MAAEIMPKVGEPVTCDYPCNHSDCKATRKMAETPCHKCGEIIDAGRRFYITDAGQVHAHCEEKDHV